MVFGEKRRKGTKRAFRNIIVPSIRISQNSFHTFAFNIIVKKAFPRRNIALKIGLKIFPYIYCPILGEYFSIGIWYLLLTSEFLFPTTKNSSPPEKLDDNCLNLYYTLYHFHALKCHSAILFLPFIKNKHTFFFSKTDHVALYY